MANMEALSKRLDTYYVAIKKLILKYQSPSIGLFPLDTNIKGPDSLCGHVRDNIYCAAAIWSLSLAYRKLDDDRGRTYELQQSAVKCMRGILFCYLRQTDRMEKFKRTQSWQDSLYSTYHIVTGDPIGDIAGQLEIDAVALYMLYLVQMIGSGLQVVYTSDEVDLIQNLVYYIERAYRTPDYGMHHTDNKKDANRELRASSIGMVLAALHAINGFNVFGPAGTSSSVIYVDPDAYHRNNTIFHTLLPRESSTRDTDAALLASVGYPAFAVTDEELQLKTKAVILNKLMGSYGLKRFVNDSYHVPVVDCIDDGYTLTQRSKNLECEWPIYLIFLSLDAIFNGDEEKSQKYRDRLKDLIYMSDGTEIVPEFYYVPKHYVHSERVNPKSQTKKICGSRYPGSLFLQGQSLYYIQQLLVDELITVDDIDVIGRHSPSSLWRQYSSKGGGSFKIQTSPVVVQIALITESRTLQSLLATYGIDTQTREQVEPVQIWTPNELITRFEQLGYNKKLGLNGRPKRPMGPLGTSKVYRLHGIPIISYPLMLDQTDFYMSLDSSVFINNLKNGLKFIHDNWNMTGRPTVCVFLRDFNVRRSHFREIFDLIYTLKTGECNGVRIRLGKLQVLLSSGCTASLDFVKEDINKILLPQIKRRDTREILSPREIRSFSMTTKKILSLEEVTEEEIDEEQLKSLSYGDLEKGFKETDNLLKKMTILNILLKDHGPGHYFIDGNILDCVNSVYSTACSVLAWSAIRYGASLLNKVVDSLAPSITTMLVKGKQVTLGIFGHEEVVVSSPLTPAEIKLILYSKCVSYNVREAVLQQELVIFLADLILSSSHLFTGMLRLRIGWIIQAMREMMKLILNSDKCVESLSPSMIRKLLIQLLSSEFHELPEVKSEKRWLYHRILVGAINRVPKNFYENVWNVLYKAPDGICVSGKVLPRSPTIKEMTCRGMGFALRVEEMLSGISKPQYRQIAVELLTVIATIAERNPELHFQEVINLNKIVMNAIELFIASNPNYEGLTLEEQEDHFFSSSPCDKNSTTTFLARAVVNQLLEGCITVTEQSPCSIT
ncbi:Phosphorylase b kinase regulatory subunit beta [Trichoplax sp. H2]|nr:Phosphorylase b kinase regulatory subunit beta [Trichoplax sp. H2]|eukprot:RDD47168.1 Phosphorylase b kinase regulatory subunit beta [Trichoplax sp. H2]